MWRDIVMKADELEAAREAAREQERTVRELAELDAEDAARSELIALLGPLAGELEITTYNRRRDGGLLIFRLRPRHWRPDIHTLSGFYARHRPDGEGWRKGWVLGANALAETTGDIRLDAPVAEAGDALVLWLAARQKAYDQAVAGRVKMLTGLLSPGSGGTTPEEAAAAHDELVELWPHETARWDDLYAAWRAAEATEAEETAAAVERFRAALIQWRDEKAAADALNRAVVSALIENVDTPVRLCDLEYAVVVADEDGAPCVETRTARVVAMGAEPHKATVLKDGKLTVWTFAHPVRLSEPYNVRPSESPDREAFARVFTPYGVVAFTDYHRAAVERVIDGLTPVPDEPLWSEIGDGRPWTNEVGRVYDEVLGNE